jgi:type II secretory pathway pseudopilin PulG
MLTGKLCPIFCTEGFTMAELVIVPSIIGMLASISIPMFLEQKDKAIVGATKANLDTMRSALNQYSIQDAENRYPAGLLAYPGFRTVVPEANPPFLEADARILSGSFLYSSDGITCVISATSASRTTKCFTATSTGNLIE